MLPRYQDTDAVKRGIHLKFKGACSFEAFELRNPFVTSISGTLHADDRPGHGGLIADDFCKFVFVAWHVTC